MSISQNLKEKYTHLIKSKAKEIGFSFCGISKADFLKEQAPHLEKWLKDNKNGKMKYMENYYDKRLNPRLLVDDAKSIISLLMNYFPQQTQQKSSYYKISKYAYGQDYHFVIKNKLKKLTKFIYENIGKVNIRYFVDSAPILERAWAVKSGLGWIGKNANLINKKNGSFFFISELITDLDLDYDNPLKRDYCANCHLCIDACPTEAITEARVIDANKCISYLTIELKDKIPDEFKNKYKNWIFGCDICQDVCPWNNFSIVNNEPAFLPEPDLLKMNKNDWEEITEEVYKELFKKTAVKRAKFNKLKNNIRFLNEK